MQTPVLWVLEMFARATQDLTFAAAALTAVDDDGRVWIQNPMSIEHYGYLAVPRTPGGENANKGVNFWQLLFRGEPVCWGWDLKLWSVK